MVSIVIDRKGFIVTDPVVSFEGLDDDLVRYEAGRRMDDASYQVTKVLESIPVGERDIPTVRKAVRSVSLHYTTATSTDDFTPHATGHARHDPAALRQSPVCTSALNTTALNDTIFSSSVLILIINIIAICNSIPSRLRQRGFLLGRPLLREHHLQDIGTLLVETRTYVFDRDVGHGDGEHAPVDVDIRRVLLPERHLGHRRRALACWPGAITHGCSGSDVALLQTASHRTRHVARGRSASEGNG